MTEPTSTTSAETGSSGETSNGTGSTGEVCNCIAALEPPPSIASARWLKVEVLGKSYPHVNGPPPYDLDAAMECGNADGWIFTSPGGPYDAIELCGQACTDVCEVG